jgi:hypothetical protein
MPLSAPPRRAALGAAALLAAGVFAAACSSSPSAAKSKGTTTTTAKGSKKAGSSTSTSKPSSTPTSNDTTNTQPVTPTSNDTKGTDPTGSTVPTIPVPSVAGVTLQISGSTVTVNFTGPAVNGKLGTAGPAFGSGGTTFAFTVTGVTYSGGGVATVGLPNDEVTQANAAAAPNGVSVGLTLRKAASHYQFKTGNNQISVTVS